MFSFLCSFHCHCLSHVLCKKIRFFTKYLQRNSAFSSIPKCTNLRKYVVDSHDATTP